MHLRAYLCHPHSDDTDLCLPYRHWVVVQDSPPYELIDLIPYAHAPDEPTLRSHLHVQGYYNDELTIDDA